MYQITAKRQHVPGVFTLTCSFPIHERYHAEQFHPELDGVDHVVSRL